MLLSHLDPDGFKTPLLLFLTMSWFTFSTSQYLFKQPTIENLKLQTTKNNQQ